MPTIPQCWSFFVLLLCLEILTAKECTPPKQETVKCACQGADTTDCTYVCEDGSELACVNGTRAKCTALCGIPNLLHLSTNTLEQCKSTGLCAKCVPSCEEGFSYFGDPLLCNDQAKWEINGECRYYGVHRVGIGVYVLNLAEINLQAGSFYIDFVLTIFTELKSYASFNDAMDTFGKSQYQRSVRECSPMVEWTNSTKSVFLTDMLSPKSVTPLGSQNPKGYRAVSPSQFINEDTTLEALSLTFATMGRGLDIQPMRGDPGSSDMNYRVKGVAYFRPDLRQWPFDTQLLEIMIEDLEQTLHSSVSFLFCHMSTYSGFSPTIRFPNHKNQLQISSSVREVCWPPFADPSKQPTTCGGDDNCIANDAPQHCTRTFKPFREESLRSFSCYCRGGKYSSSRYVTTISFKAPSAQRFIKAYLPAVMISFINSMSYLMPYKDYSQRITICVGTLTALVLFHVSLTNQLPPSTTNTLADWLMLNCYFLNWISWIVTISIMLMTKATWVNDFWPQQTALFFRWLGPLAATVLVAVASFERDVWMGEKESAMAWLKIVFAVFGCVILAIICRHLESRVTRWCTKVKGPNPGQRLELISNDEDEDAEFVSLQPMGALRKRIQ
eukprot:m.342683 g.342683  ORF g.342683 m.342683 type:complete len:613 (+) comp21714_c0_seq1:376-2214(+)